MTLDERLHHKIINSKRKQRIAKGSGTDIRDVNKLLKQFEQARKMMKKMTGIKRKTWIENAASFPNGCCRFDRKNRET